MPLSCWVDRQAVVIEAMEYYFNNKKEEITNRHHSKLNQLKKNDRKKNRKNNKEEKRRQHNMKWTHVFKMENPLNKCNKKDIQRYSKNFLE